MTSRLDFVFGARFSHEEKDATTLINGVAPLTGTQSEIAAALLNEINNEAHCSGVVAVASLCDNASWTDKNEEDEWTATLKLAYALTDDVNVYGSYSRGYKAGGFNLDQQAIEIDYFGSFLAAGGAPVFLGANAPPAKAPLDPGCVVGATNPPVANAPCTVFDDDHAFDPEFVNAWELGMKGQFFDRTLTTNAALFYSRYQSFQLNTFTGTGFLISNTRRMTSKGVELETQYTTPIDGVFLTFGVTYADTRYGGSLNEAGQDERSLFLAANSVADFDVLEDFAALENIENRQVTHAPYWQGSTSLFIERQIPTVELMGYANFNIAYRGKHNTGSDLDPEKIQDGYTLVNAQLGVRTVDERYEAEIWARNLTDKQVNTIVFDSVFQAGSFSRFFSPPRMVGVTLRTNF